MSDLMQLCALTVELPTPGGWVKPVNEVSLRIAPGESLALVGESGSGKTMLSLALMGLLPPGARVSGEIRWRSATLQDLNRETNKSDSEMQRTQENAEGPVRKVLISPQHPYTLGLLAASPTLERRVRKLIPGTVPQLMELPAGCAFARRCSFRRDECDKAVPEFRQAEADHAARCVLL